MTTVPTDFAPQRPLIAPGTPAGRHGDMPGTIEGAEATGRWYAVHTLPRGEATAEAHLLRQGFEVFLPRFARVVRHARKIKRRKAPLFPRYGFVRLDLTRQRWRSVNGTAGVASLVMGRDLPLAVPTGVVEALLACATCEGVVDLDHGLRPGDPVRLIAGPLAGQLGILTRLDDRGRVEMLLSLLAGKVRLTVAREMPEPVG